MSAAVKVQVEHDGKTYQGRYAFVGRTALGYEDHGILTAYLHLEGPGWGQSAGGYALDAWDETLDARIGTAFGTKWIIAVLSLFGGSDWESITGRSVIALYADPDGYGRIVGLADPVSGRVLIFSEIQP